MLRDGYSHFETGRQDAVPCPITKEGCPGKQNTQEHAIENGLKHTSPLVAARLEVPPNRQENRPGFMGDWKT